MISARCDIFAAPVQLEQIERRHITNETYLAAFDKDRKIAKGRAWFEENLQPSTAR
jgi:hypothetical protein